MKIFATIVAAVLLVQSSFGDERRSLKGSSGSSKKEKKSSSSKHHSSSSKSSSKKSSSQLTVGDGVTFLTKSVNGLVITDSSTSCTLATGSGKTYKTKCLRLESTTVPNHAVGGWCQGGLFEKKLLSFPDAMTTSCECQRLFCDSTCTDLCLECTPEPQLRSYLIPLSPVLLDDEDEYMAAKADNNYGVALALNGVPLAKGDPYNELKAENNVAPFDTFGGHSTLQYTYHVRPPPHLFLSHFACPCFAFLAHLVFLPLLSGSL